MSLSYILSILHCIETRKLTKISKTGRKCTANQDVHDLTQKLNSILSITDFKPKLEKSVAFKKVYVYKCLWLLISIREFVK